MTGDDMVLPFQLDRSALRGRVARLDATLEEILSRRDYPAPVAALVSEAALLTALVGAVVKLRWKLSLQIRGEGPIRLIATDFYAPEREGEAGRIRAWASFDNEADLDGADPFALLGQGVFGIMVDQGKGMQPYQGLTPLAGGSLAVCAGTYFAQSEQIATRFMLASAEAHAPGEAAAWRAGGVMLQQVPAEGGSAPDAPAGSDGLMSADDVAAMGPDEEGWSRANILLDTVEHHELLGPVVTPEGLLVRLFHEEVPRVFEARTVRFGCTCSADRVRAALAQYSAKDIGHMTTPEGIVTADCQFCGAHYRFDPDELGFEAGRGASGGMAGTGG